LVRVLLIDKGFEVVKGNTTKIRDSKKKFLSILHKFSLTDLEVYLALENKCPKFIRTSTTKGIRFLDTLASPFR